MAEPEVTPAPQEEENNDLNAVPPVDETPEMSDEDKFKALQLELERQLIKPDSAEVAEQPETVAPEENADLYTVQAADLNAYPELSQQGVQLYQQVPYLSLTVSKWATAEQLSTVSEPWPRKVSDVTGNRITFNE